MGNNKKDIFFVIYIYIDNLIFLFFIKKFFFIFYIFIFFKRNYKFPLIQLILG
jgi:hypothetical protein